MIFVLVACESWESWGKVQGREEEEAAQSGRQEEHLERGRRLRKRCTSSEYMLHRSAVIFFSCVSNKTWTVGYSYRRKA